METIESSVYIPSEEELELLAKWGVQQEPYMLSKAVELIINLALASNGEVNMYETAYNELPEFPEIRHAIGHVYPSIEQLSRCEQATKDKELARIILRQIINRHPKLRGFNQQGFNDIMSFNEPEVFADPELFAEPEIIDFITKELTGQDANLAFILYDKIKSQQGLGEFSYQHFGLEGLSYTMLFSDEVLEDPEFIGFVVKELANRLPLFPEFAHLYNRDNELLCKIFNRELNIQGLTPHVSMADLIKIEPAYLTFGDNNVIPLQEGFTNFMPSIVSPKEITAGTIQYARRNGINAKPYYEGRNTPKKKVRKLHEFIQNRRINN